MILPVPQQFSLWNAKNGNYLFISLFSANIVALTKKTGNMHKALEKSVFILFIYIKFHN